MIKAIIFDFGGVLVSDPSLKLNQKVAKIFAINPKLLTKIYRGQNLKNFERGLINARVFRNNLKKQLQKQTGKKVSLAQIKLFEKTLTDQFVPYPRFFNYVKSLKKHRRIVMLTNNIPTFMRVWYRRFKLKRIFPAIITSYTAGTRKPGIAIYRYCCRKINLQPSECLFIDDQPKNITGARKAGLKAVRFTTEKATISKIKKQVEGIR